MTEVWGALCWHASVAMTLIGSSSSSAYCSRGRGLQPSSRSSKSYYFYFQSLVDCQQTPLSLQDKTNLTNELEHLSEELGEYFNTSHVPTHARTHVSMHARMPKKTLFPNAELNLLSPGSGCPLQAGTGHGRPGRAPGRC